MTENISALAEEGYMPTSVDMNSGTISFVKLANHSFSEVWYGDSIAASDEPVRTASIDALRREYREQRDGQRLSAIGHVSRCGSTLLANLLALRSSTIVLKEPDFVTDLCRDIVACPSKVGQQSSTLLLHSLLNFTCDAAGHVARDLVIKTTSWTTPIILDALCERPDTTWLLQWRDPDEVAASNISEPSSWGTESENGIAARLMAGDLEVSMNFASFYATVWAKIINGFVSLGHTNWRALEYQDFLANKAHTLLAVERWFQIGSDSVPLGFTEEAARYSKGPRDHAFEPNGAHSRRALASDYREQVERLTTDARRALALSPHIEIDEA